MVLSAYLLAAAVTTTEPKTEKQPRKDCFQVESLISDLQKDGFNVIRGDRDVAKSYLGTLARFGGPEPPDGIDAIEGILFITLPKTPDKVMVSLIDRDNNVCHSTIIPTQIHEAILRGV